MGKPKTRGISRISSGHRPISPVSFESLLSQFQPVINQYAEKFAKTQSGWKDDFVAEAYVGLFTLYEQHRLLGCWLTRPLIVRAIFTRMIDFYRKHIQRHKSIVLFSDLIPEDDSDDADPSRPIFDSDNLAGSRWLTEELSAKIDVGLGSDSISLLAFGLTERQKETYTLYLEGYNSSEISDMIGVSPARVSILLKKAKQQVLNYLSKQGYINSNLN